MRRIAVLSILVVLVGVPTGAQTALPAFEVVSVKPNDSVGQSGRISGPGTSGPYTITNISLRAIILYAYELREYQLIEAPGWTSGERFDITATYPEGADRSQYRMMIQKVLADRFQLRVRRETRELPVYRLVQMRENGPLGPQLVPSDVDCQRWFAEKRPQMGAGGKSPVVPGGVRIACAMGGQRNFISGHAQPISRLAMMLESRVGRPIVDATGLKGNFDIDVVWAAESAVDGGVGQLSPFETSASIFTALQEQLGLKLEPNRGPVDVLVVESVSRPTPD